VGQRWDGREGVKRMRSEGAKDMISHAYTRVWNGYVVHNI
jgi:hypothetical protein